VLTAWKAGHPSASGHQGGYELREIVNAILYQSRTGCQREYLPHDLPPRSAACCYFARWRDDGTGQAIHDLLRWHTGEEGPHGRPQPGRDCEHRPASSVSRVYRAMTGVMARRLTGTSVRSWRAA
jgi:transposase